MIPQIIHYCWFGHGELSELAINCIKSWHKYMPEYEYILWNEDNFDVNGWDYTKEAYRCGKFAFVSDVARLKVLKEYGGIYFDVDFLVYKPFDRLLEYKAFAGFEGSKYNPVMMGVLGSEPGGVWVKEQLDLYNDRHFILDGREDLTTNVKYISDHMKSQGFIPDGKEQDFKGLHIFPVEFFCPRLTTGEYRRTEDTYCESISHTSSWAGGSNWKSRLLSHFNSKTKTGIILLKRKIFG